LQSHSNGGLGPQAPAGIGAESRLFAVLRDILAAHIAVSGGVDSLTLAEAAHRTLGPAARMHHAVSPAVPPEATARTRALAASRGWDLTVFDAGEFADPRYRANPVDRCFWCKTSLYGTLASFAASHGGGVVLSGTNTDDLQDIRPGLTAAAQHGVRHPFVEAGIDKATVRQLAASFGLGEVAELPASPCLSSRIETGIRVEPDMLALVHRVERHVATALAPRVVRCRVRAAGVVVELDAVALATLGNQREKLSAELLALTGRQVSFAAYRIGSAFLRTPA